MAEKTEIAWADSTFNCWIGCTKISTEATGGGGCDQCYAAQQDSYRRWTPEGWGGPRKRTKTWDQPVKWNAAHAAFYAEHGRRQRVFCASLADWADNQVPIEWLIDLLDLIRTTPHLIWMVLTKRVGIVMARLREAKEAISFETRRDLWLWLKAWINGEEAPENVWIGATVVNQMEADRDIPKLLYLPARVRFLSIEPILGPIAIPEVFLKRLDYGAGPKDWPDNAGVVSWIIVGAESGPKARPAQLEWMRSIVTQCKAAGTPVHVKQLGKYVRDSGCSSPGEHWPVDMKRIPIVRYTENDPPFELALRHAKGGDMAEWPEDMRVREFPT